MARFFRVRKDVFDKDPKAGGHWAPWYVKIAAKGCLVRRREATHSGHQYELACPVNCCDAPNYWLYSDEYGGVHHYSLEPVL